MAEAIKAGPVDNTAVIREAVSIHTRKIFDSCRDKDCIDNLRVYPTESSQTYIENALSIRPKAAQLLYAAVQVEPISFKRGWYTVDCTYFYRVTGETFPAGQATEGLAVFDKRAMLFGSEAGVMTFTSTETAPPSSPASELPIAVVDAVNPIALHAQLVDAATPGTADLEGRTIPDFITAAFSEPLVLTDTTRRWLTTIGQFSTLRLERECQLLIPAYDYSMPSEDCPGNAEDDPCELFSRIPFPVEEFFPPDSMETKTVYQNML